MDYLWTIDAASPGFPTLGGSASTDVLIIGGGMAGVLCALKLHEAGADYMLVEGKRIGGGITKGTTAVISAQHSTLYQDLSDSFGKNMAERYLRANLRAVERFRALAKDISCDFAERPSVMYSRDDRALMEREAAVVRSLGFAAEFTTDTPLPHAVAGAVRYHGMAQFHPLKFLYGAAKRLNIRENTFVTKLAGTNAVTPHGTIKAKKVIVATHYPFLNRHGLFFAKLYQKRSFVIALENAPELHCTTEDIADDGIYMRNYNGLLIIGGGDHRTGRKGGGFDMPRAFARQYYPEAREKYAWANQDCISLDGVPYIGRYSPNLPDVYVASGFNEWGMTSSMVAADILADMVLGRESEYSSTFLPNRSILTGQLFANIGTTVADLATPTTKRCSHMGCALKWNAAERSWDCPCHGSRFDEKGHIIDNPAMSDISAVKE